MSYKTEFPPEFHAIPEGIIVPGVVDNSWHNDASPSFGVEGVDCEQQGYITLWVNPENPKDREMESMERFMICVGPTCTDTWWWATDDATELVRVWGRIVEIRFALKIVQTHSTAVELVKAIVEGK